MRPLKRTATAVVAVAVATGMAVLAAPNPAHADIQPAVEWEVLDTAVPGGARTPSAHSTIVDATTADATWESGEAASSGGTSIENANLNIPVEVGDVVSVDYELKDGADPAAGAVRLFIYMKPNADTFNEAPDQFAFAPIGPTSGTLTINVATAGTLGTAGLVYDTSNGGVPGTVRFTNLTVNQETVLFKWEKTPPATTPPATSEPPVAGPELPKTGASTTVVVLTGLVLLVAGVVLAAFAARRRRALR